MRVFSQQLYMSNEEPFVVQYDPQDAQSASHLGAEREKVIASKARTRRDSSRPLPRPEQR